MQEGTIYVFLNSKLQYTVKGDVNYWYNRPYLRIADLKPTPLMVRDLPESPTESNFDTFDAKRGCAIMYEDPYMETHVGCFFYIFHPTNALMEEDMKNFYSFIQYEMPKKSRGKKNHWWNKK